MNQSRPAAERVRPILQAMERSIDAARRRRLHQVESVDREEETVQTHEESTSPAEEQPAGRLKATPKRSSRLPGYNGSDSVHSRAS